MRKAVFLICIMFAITSCKEKQANVVKTKKITFTKDGSVTISKSNGDKVVTLDAEFADTDYKRETGLMYRNSMQDDQCMLFLFSNEFPRNFYMKNTNIPLDIIYIGANQKIVSFRENAVPHDETGLPSEVPAKYVLEVNAGLAEKWLLEIGDIISFSKDK